MAEERPELGAILARLETVEKQNRNLKCGGMVAALLVAMMFIMGQAKPNRTLRAESIRANTIEAQSILLRDEQGDVLGSLSAALGTASLSLGKQGDRVFMSTADPDGPFIHIEGGGNGDLRLGFAGGPSFLFMGKGSTALLHLSSEGPSFELTDKEGFEAQLGSSSLMIEKTGEKHQTSAASVVLFGKDKKVLWSAP